MTRNERIRLERLTGGPANTYRAIGARYGISRERVRQLVAQEAGAHQSLKALHDQPVTASPSIRLMAPRSIIRLWDASHAIRNHYDSPMPTIPEGPERGL